MENIDHFLVDNLFCLKSKIFKITRVDNKNSSKLENSSGKRKLVCYKRQEKSLFELSKKFLLRHWNLKNYIINLEILTNELDIERRRLYDIINILESLGIIY